MLLQKHGIPTDTLKTYQLPDPVARGGGSGGGSGVGGGGGGGGG